MIHYAGCLGPLYLGERGWGLLSGGSRSGGSRWSWRGRKKEFARHTLFVQLIQVIVGEEPKACGVRRHHGSATGQLQRLGRGGSRRVVVAGCRQGKGVQRRRA